MSGAPLPDSQLTTAAAEQEEIHNVLAQLGTTLAPFPLALGEMCVQLRKTNKLLRAMIPKTPEYELITIQTGAWWKAHKRGYNHLRLLAAHAITMGVDVPGIGPGTTMSLTAGVVTEFFLPENSLLTVTLGGTGPSGSEPVLMIWDDVT